MALSSQFLQHNVWSNSEFRRTLSVPPLLKANHEPVKKLSQRKLKIRGIKNKSNSLVTFSMLNPESGTSMSAVSPSDTIKKFYSSINNKDMNQLALLLAENCFYDDFSYSQPFQRREEALKFLEQLATCMGKNTEYCIEHIYEGVDLTIVVNWHLEWNKKQVPFTRGCSCYELSRDGEELVIRKAQVIVESPIKPGSIALV
uniref:SnoaL-like domain-containing protein n=1 Tax=Solanum tuberosum TaxID=4113 RepID=M1AWW1_SOLTU